MYVVRRASDNIKLQTQKKWEVDNTNLRKPDLNLICIGKSNDFYLPVPCILKED